MRVLEPSMSRTEQLWLSAALFWYTDVVASRVGGSGSLEGLAKALGYLQQLSGRGVSPIARCGL